MSELLDPFSFLVVSLSGWMNQHQQHVIHYLMEENRVLRRQIGNRRMHFSDDQRRRLAARAKATLAFGVEIDKDVVRRILATHFHPEAGSGGPSWLSLIGNAKDSLWSLDLFRCESAVLRTYWVLVVMDQFTRRIVGFAVHRGVVDGLSC